MVHGLMKKYLIENNRLNPHSILPFHSEVLTRIIAVFVCFPSVSYHARLAVAWANLELDADLTFTVLSVRDQMNIGRFEYCAATTRAVVVITASRHA